MYGTVEGWIKYNCSRGYYDNISMNSWLKYCYRWLFLPGLVGLFFGVGHFLSFLLFSQEPFKRFE